MARVDPKLVFGGKRLLRTSLGLALVGWVGLAIGVSVEPKATYFAYLTAFAFVTSIALGALIFLMVTYLVRARWSVVIRRLNEALVSVFPILALSFVPLLFGMRELYAWVEPHAGFTAEELELLHHKQAYLNVPAFALRSAGYFTIWSIAAFKLRSWSAARDRETPTREDSDRVHARERVLSAALLPFVALAVTFAAFDWLMSLQPLWMSTLFGVYYFAGGFVASFAALSLLAWAARSSGMLEGLVRPPHFHALGRLMFGFSIFWAYSAFFQAMLIRIANRPDEVEFYLRRSERGWDAVLLALVLARFAFPFAFLLSRGIKFQGGAMAAIGVWILVGHYIDVFWLVAPVDASHPPFANAWDLAALLALLGTSVAYGALRLRGNPVVPVGDPLLPHSVEYRSPT